MHINIYEIQIEELLIS